MTDPRPEATCERCRQLEEDHARFLRALAHELRTPLSSILILAELAAEGPGTGEGQRDKLEKIRRAGTGLKAVLDQVTTLVKTTDGSLEPSFAACDVGRLMAELVAEHGEKARLDLVAPPDGAPVLSDRLLLRQAVEALLGHALAVTREGRVGLAVDVRDGVVAVLVQDGGRAVPEAARRVLFEPFAADAPRTSGEATLALPVAGALADLLGARLGVESRDPKGNTWTLLLPGDPHGSPLD